MPGPPAAQKSNTARTRLRCTFTLCRDSRRSPSRLPPTFRSSPTGARRCCLARAPSTSRTRPKNSSLSTSCGRAWITTSGSCAHFFRADRKRMSSTERIPVAILGATGAVGQTFVRLLADHPWFRVAEVAASERSAGKSYAEATHWIEGELPADVAALTVQPCDPVDVTSTVVFSALDSAVAGDLEPAFARAGRFVLSNAKNFRMEPDVPLVIPEVNAAHLALVA